MARSIAQRVNFNACATGSEPLESWLDVAESYWSQFVWTPYHKRQRASVAESSES